MRPPPPPPPIPVAYYHPAPRKSLLPILLPILAVVFIVAAALTSISMPKPRESDYAISAARMIVLDKMKDAKAEIDPSSIQWRQRSDGRVEVWGKVVGKNGFGVAMRETWKIVLEKAGATQWRAAWIKIGDQTSGDYPKEITSSN